MSTRAAGYSGTPLPKKLGIRPGTKGAVLQAPSGYTRALGPLPDGASLATRLGRSHDFVHLFVKSRRELQQKTPGIMKALSPAGAYWVSWPKKSSGVVTDVTEDVIRDIVLPLGLVDVKVCAVDQMWSGLKIVRRLSNR